MRIATVTLHSVVQCLRSYASLWWYSNSKHAFTSIEAHVVVYKSQFTVKSLGLQAKVGCTPWKYSHTAASNHWYIYYLISVQSLHKTFGAAACNGFAMPFCSFRLFDLFM